MVEGIVYQYVAQVKARRWTYQGAITSFLERKQSTPVAGDTCYAKTFVDDVLENIDERHAQEMSYVKGHMRRGHT